MVGVFTDGTASLLFVIVTIFDATLSPTNALIFPTQVITVTLKDLRPLPNSDGKGMQFECGKNFAIRHVFRESFDTDETLTDFTIFNVATYTVVHLNEREEVMNLVRVDGEPFGFYLKKLKEDVHILILDNPFAKNVAKMKTKTLAELMAETE